MTFSKTYVQFIIFEVLKKLLAQIFLTHRRQRVENKIIFSQNLNEGRNGQFILYSNYCTVVVVITMFSVKCIKRTTNCANFDFFILKPIRDI